MIHLILGGAGLVVCSIWFARLHPTVAAAIGAFASGAIVARLTT
jgi:hypothetical protein